MGSLNVLECSRLTGVRKVVYAASGGTLYGEPRKLPVKETARTGARPVSPYGISKKVVIDYLVFYERYHGLEWTALALANVYGPRQDPHGEAGVVAIFSSEMLAGRGADDLRGRQPDTRLRLRGRRRARLRARCGTGRRTARQCRNRHRDFGERPVSDAVGYHRVRRRARPRAGSPRRSSSELAGYRACGGRPRVEALDAPRRRPCARRSPSSGDMTPWSWSAERRLNCLHELLRSTSRRRREHFVVASRSEISSGARLPTECDDLVDEACRTAPRPRDGCAVRTSTTIGGRPSARRDIWAISLADGMSSRFASRRNFSTERAAFPPFIAGERGRFERARAQARDVTKRQSPCSSSLTEDGADLLPERSRHAPPKGIAAFEAHPASSRAGVPPDVT